MKISDRTPRAGGHKAGWSIRGKIIALLLVPLLSLGTLWIFATSLTMTDALLLLDAQTTDKLAIEPSEALIDELRVERQLSMVYLGNGRTGSTELRAQRQRTDAAAAQFRRSTSDSDLRDVAEPATLDRIADVLAGLDSLPVARESIDRGELDRFGTMRLYSSIIDSCTSLYTTLYLPMGADLLRQTNGLILYAHLREKLSQENALIHGALAAGKATAADLAEITKTIGARRAYQAVATDDVPDPDAYQRLLDSPTFLQVAQLEDQIISAGRPDTRLPVDGSAWRTTYTTADRQISDYGLAAGEVLLRSTTPIAIGILVRLAVAALLGLLAVVVTIVLSIRLGRDIIGRLGRLRGAAQELAQERLPRVVTRLRRGEEVDVATEAPPLDFGVDEIGQVGHAFTEVQRTAIGAAVEESGLRKGYNEVFLNIARRSQTLLHRQLTLLDRMERRATEPDELEDLFRVDHLATRMRRHAEDLVILAGSAPGRGWRKPVPVIDVIRGAASEVEDYARISIRPVADTAIAGRAVGDLIHLFAELLENATSYSPPQSRVYVSGEEVANGYAVEIEDRGLGLAPELIAEANARLSDPPEFDPTNSAQLGLIVVARLAARHRIQVGLRSSPYGGITAVVLIPHDLITAEVPPGDHEDTGEVPIRTPALALASTGDGDRTPRRVSGRHTGSGQRPAAASSGPRHAASHPVGQDGLPRRVRQASLAPQLKETTGGSTAVEAGPATGRSADQMRQMMTSYQEGIARARRTADGAEGDSRTPAGDSAGDPGPAEPREDRP